MNPPHSQYFNRTKNEFFPTTFLADGRGEKPLLRHHCELLWFVWRVLRPVLGLSQEIRCQPRLPLSSRDFQNCYRHRLPKAAQTGCKRFPADVLGWIILRTIDPCATERQPKLNYCSGWKEGTFGNRNHPGLEGRERWSNLEVNPTESTCFLLHKVTSRVDLFLRSRLYKTW